jgi:hypothetical protein
MNDSSLLCIQNERLEKNREMRYKLDPDVVAMGSAFRSLYFVTQYIDLPEAGIQAIAHHDDQHIKNDGVIANRVFYHPWSSPSVGS